MTSKLALLVASLTAALVLAAGLALTGFGPQSGPDAVQLAEPVAATADAPAPEPTIQVDTVYLAPRPTPQDVVVTKVRDVAPATAERDDDETGGDD
jgi:hypothetical protein